MDTRSNEGTCKEAFEPIRQDEEFIVYRACDRTFSDAESVLLLVPVAVRPTIQTRSKIEHEYSLRNDLNSAWAVKPLAISEHFGRPTLVLEDPGGETLDTLLTGPMEIKLFLRLAVGLATALGRVYESGLIHKNIKPANVLVKPATGQIRLTGFGIASRLLRERQEPEPPELITGTLPYMAPEQTGRMNRSIDSRSDLYSLGVTLYEMLTGTLPFNASDPMEWVHCHIAKMPAAPSERVREIPSAVSSIVMMLLAKTPDERYRTALGLERDLRRCLDEWETRQRIDEFPLRQRDKPDRLLIPEKLYGRESEIAALLTSFERVIKSGTPELVLMSGHSGIGKSSVVNELQKALVPPRGLFASGKFDQYKRDIPYSTLVQALESLTRLLLSKSEADLKNWRDAIREALGPNGRLMIDLVPELKLIIREQPPVPDLPPQDAQRRFQLVFRRFLGVFARPEHPLTLFLDDLQWLDSATLEVLEGLLTQADVKHLFMIGAYRDNEVDAAHPLARKFDAIRKTGGGVSDIKLSPLSQQDVTQLIADALQCQPEPVLLLAQLVYDRTAGNPFFTIQFLSALEHEKLLTFDHVQGHWSWDFERIHSKGYTDNVVDVMVRKLTRLPDETQKALQQLACLGNAVNVTTLSLVSGTAEDQVHSDLFEAIRAEMVEQQMGLYKFVHDRVQEAAYSLIPERIRPEAHLRIGRLLLAHTPPGERVEAIFEIVNQLNRGTGLISSREERDDLAELNLIAGQRAKASAAFASALTYLVSGAAMLAEDCWERRHDLTFTLGLNLAECEYVTAQLGPAEDRLAALAGRAATGVERAAVAALRVDLYTTLDQYNRAIAVGLAYLRDVGIQCSPHPSEGEARREYDWIWSQLGTRAIEDLIELPLLNDPASIATLDILTKLTTCAGNTDVNLPVLLGCRAINLALELGNCDASCVAYEWLAMIARARFGDYHAGYRFGRLGYELAQRQELKRFQPRIYQLFASHVIPWTRPIKTGRDLLLRAFEAANSVGYVITAAVSGYYLVMNMLVAGDLLVEVEGEAKRSLEFAEKARFGLVSDISAAQLGLVRTLRGLTKQFGLLDDEQFEELAAERRFASNPNLQSAECFYWIRKLQARFIAGDYAASIEASLRAQQLLGTSASLCFEMAEYHFYSALARAACCDSVSTDERQHHLEALAAHQQQIEMWAQNCPENFADRAALVGAEIERIEGRDLDAMRLYEKAIWSAHTNGFVHNRALAYERASAFHRGRGFEQFADTYLRNARSCYLRWGADGKVRQLDELYPSLRAQEPPTGLRGTIATPVEHLDLATVIKVSQAVSSEIVLENLIDMLLRIAIEHGGAQRGLLILARDAEFRIQAEATTRGTEVSITLREAPTSSVELPEGVIRYAARTQEPVILEDAPAQGSFTGDEYIHRTHARSILCLPLVKQGELIALLYLENNLAPNVFTSARIAVLKVLASAAAISLENSRLYRDIKEREANIKALKDQLYRENVVLKEEVDRTSMFEEIIGASAALQAALASVAKVAPTDSTVLITGETGTGKELIARAIHKRAKRSQRTFVSVNCAALAPSLISSELFGHEKGAFTGATERRIGRFELADGGTIFLDEVGELPPDTQVALLRVLQEREFERVGGTQAIKVDVRVIAATNRDLEAAVARGAFRADLYYRLDVFPIRVPPLRERKDDILMLVEYFIQRYARRIGKNIRSIDKSTLELFQSYDWPGNIRELQNVIERSVILSSSEVLRLDKSLLPRASSERPVPVQTSLMSEAERGEERKIIEAALAGSKGRVAGPGGAAAKLGIPPSTLRSKIKTLKISKTQFKYR